MRTDLDQKTANHADIKPGQAPPSYNGGMTLLNAISLLGACNPLLLNTESTQTTEFIGYYVETTPVDSETWIRIEEDEEDILFAADAGGRDINIYFDQNGIPIIFYKATAELGRITGYREIDSSFESFQFMFNQLCYCSENELFSQSLLDDVCGYFRSFNSLYTTSIWNYYAGAPNAEYISNVRNKRHDMLSFERYFGSVLASDSSTNTMYHNVVTEHFGVNDPTENNQKIDLCHMFASIDLIDGSNYSANHAHNCNILEDIFTWGGDMQTEFRRLYDQQSSALYNYDFLNNSLENPDSYFPFSDLLADIDALNIALNLTGNGFDFQFSFNIYYAINTSFSSRKQRFVSNVIQHNRDSFNFVGYDVFRAKVYDFMRLRLNGNGSISDSEDGNEYMRYLLLSTSRNAPLSQRLCFANSIIDFFEE